MIKHKIFTLALLCCMPVAMAANYKWTDEKGQTHYGQRPPAGVEAEKIKSSSASSSAQQEIDQFKSKQEAELKEQQLSLEEEEKRMQEKEERKIWRANCKAAQVKLASLEEKPKVRKRDTYGNVSVLPEKKIQQHIKQAKEEVELYCNPPSSDLTTTE